ncbi:MAG: sulfotransferase family 2 domain-containing protein [Cyanobacteria bacterium P01_H01_bin.15]
MNQCAAVSSPLTIFMHIPKAAGTTLRYIIQYQAPPQRIYELYGSAANHSRRLAQLQHLTPEQRQGIRFVSGHLGFGLHRYFEQPATYITVLRNPVNRVISMYSYLCKTRSNFRESLTLEEFIRHAGRYTQNNLTKYFSGAKLAIQVHEPHLLEENADRLYPVDDAALSLAKENIVNYFSVTGLIEHFDETLVLMQELLGWRLPLYSRSNVSSSEQIYQDVDPSVIELIEDVNKYDIELYNFVENRFHEQLAAQPPSFFNYLNDYVKAKEEAQLRKLADGCHYYINRVTHRFYKEVVRRYAY